MKASTFWQELQGSRHRSSYQLTRHRCTVLTATQQLLVPRMKAGTSSSQHRPPLQSTSSQQHPRQQHPHAWYSSAAAFRHRRPCSIPIHRSSTATATVLVQHSHTHTSSHNTAAASSRAHPSTAVRSFPAASSTQQHSCTQELAARPRCTRVPSPTSSCSIRPLAGPPPQHRSSVQHYRPPDTSTAPSSRHYSHW